MYSPYVVTIGSACCGCGACARRCPRENFSVGEAAATVKDGYVCVGCMACAAWCPTKALAVEPAQPATVYMRAR